MHFDIKYNNNMYQKSQWCLNKYFGCMTLIFSFVTTLQEHAENQFCIPWFLGVREANTFSKFGNITSKMF